MEAVEVVVERARWLALMVVCQMGGVARAMVVVVVVVVYLLRRRGQQRLQPRRRRLRPTSKLWLLLLLLEVGAMQGPLLLMLLMPTLLGQGRGEGGQVCLRRRVIQGQRKAVGMQALRGQLCRQTALRLVLQLMVMLERQGQRVRGRRRVLVVMMAPQLGCCSRLRAR
jgi:hypothetical protein